MANSTHRTESDLLGSVMVPKDALYGAHTQRAVSNFPLASDRSIGHYPHLVTALIRIKWAAAQVNRKIDCLGGDLADAITASARDLVTNLPADQFPVHHLHGGGGTSANMNSNEVLANCAEQRLGGRRGQYRLVHPNDHVNLHQSSNDVYPTACRMAVIGRWPQLSESLARLLDTLEANAARLRQEPRLARTCLQDAVEVTFADLMGSYEALVRRGRDRIAHSVDGLHAVNLGGTIVGRVADVPEAYRTRIIPALQAVSEDPAYHLCANFFDAAQNPDDLVAASGEVELLARGLIKIAKDLRLLGSGPEAGLGEIQLPPVQPGSSIMPGKVNPVIPEFAAQCCFQIIGHHAACANAIAHGDLDLNIWESLIVFNLLDSMDLLANATATLATRCLKDLAVIRERNLHHVRTIIPLLTQLARDHSYSSISRICQRAGPDARRVRTLLQEEGFI